MERLKKIFKFAYFAEAITWLIILVIVIFNRYTPPRDVGNEVLLMYAGGILIIALIYYYILYKILPYTKIPWIKNIGDLILIGLLLYLARNSGIYLTGLFFIPIAASMFILGTINSLLLAVLTVVILALNFFLIQDSLGQTSSQYTGLWSILSVTIIIIYVRALSHQITYYKNLQKDAAKKLEAVNNKLKSYEELEKEFVSLTAHQLFTPLSVVRGFLSMILQKDFGPLTAKQAKYLDESYQYTIRMIKLIRELLNISRIESGHYIIQTKRINIYHIIQNIVKELKPIAKLKNIDIVINEPPAAVTEVIADADKIPEIFLNIIDNAIKYSHPESKVEISFQIIHRDNVPYLSTQIKDHGVGIPASEQEHIFQRFFRATNILEIENQGTGLGLFIAKKLVEQQKGTISFESEENKGTTFTIVLPTTKS